MAVNTLTVARPYAEAAFACAKELDQLDQWSEMLAFLVGVQRDPQFARVADDPEIGRGRLTDLLLGICADRLTKEGANLVRLLVENGRLPVLPQISELFEHLKYKDRGSLEVEVSSAYVLNPAQEKEIADALAERLGRDISISSHKDPSLIGGLIIRAGDTVIDGSIKGQLSRMATELGI